MAGNEQMTIWKWPLLVENWPEVVIEAPGNTQWLTVQLQDGLLTVWGLVNAEAERKQYRFTIYPTGGEAPLTLEGYLATLQIDWTVWHIFWSQ